MRRLVVCNTNYQIIMAIHMKMTIFNDDEIDICITDHIQNYKNIAEGIEKTKLFSKILLFDSIDIVKQKNKLKQIIDAILIGTGILYCKKKYSNNYNEILLYNLDVSTFILINMLEKTKNEVVLSKYDEGVFSYNTDFYISGMRYKIIKKLRFIRKKRDIENSFTNFYCCFPRLLKIHKEWKRIEVPQLDSSNYLLKKYLKDVYGECDEDFEKKFIYFASSSDIDNCPYGERELVKKIADKVGIENLIIKKHPRDTTTYFEKSGIVTMKHSALPWETMQILLPANEYVLLTITSGAFISISAMMENGCKGFFLYPEVENFNETYIDYIKRVQKMIDDLHSIGKCKNINVCRIDEIV